MQNQHQRRVFYSVGVLISFATVATALSLPRIAPIIGVIGFVSLAMAYRAVKSIGAGDEDERERHQARQAERGRTILVPLVDDAGNELDPAAAERKLEQARLRAGPKDIVVGVRRRGPEA